MILRIIVRLQQVGKIYLTKSDLYKICSLQSLNLIIHFKIQIETWVVPRASENILVGMESLFWSEIFIAPSFKEALQLQLLFYMWLLHLRVRMGK